MPVGKKDRIAACETQKERALESIRGTSEGSSSFTEKLTVWARIPH